MAAEIREDYLESLGDLTVASRPIIKTLTEIAQENVDQADAIVDAIAQHCLQCPPNQKLPALYLIDSVCKNNGEPYVSLFAPRIVSIFNNAFEVSPEATRVKLSEQFKTWTVPNPVSGAPLFPHDALRSINDFMMTFRARSNGGAPPPMAPPRSAPQRLNQSALLVEINRYRSVLDPDQEDPFMEKQMQMLDRFEAQVSGVVDPKLLPQIQAELDGLKTARDQYISRSMRRAPAQKNTRRDTRSRGPRGGVAKASSRVPSASKQELDAIGQSFASEADFEIASEEGLPQPPQPPHGMNMPPPSVFMDMIKGFSNELPILDLAAASKADATPAQISQLYSAGLPLQCSTCGYRFKDNEEGRAAKQAEMDWHFRANKDIREGRSRSRCWFLTIVQWVAYRDEDEVFGSGSQISNIEAMPASAESASVDLEKEREKFIEVPLDSNAVCPVCQEPHETSWSEEAENWVWMNTVDVDGLYFHATCYADPQNKDLVAAVFEEQRAN